jgi:hypothetical protein
LESQHSFKTLSNFGILEGLHEPNEAAKTQKLYITTVIGRLAVRFIGLVKLDLQALKLIFCWENCVTAFKNSFTGGCKINRNSSFNDVFLKCRFELFLSSNGGFAQLGPTKRSQVELKSQPFQKLSIID